MLNLHDLFNDFLADDGFSLTELVTTAGVWLGRLTQVNPAGVFTERINGLQTALTALETNTTDAGVKLALQKSATANKRAFREALQDNMSKVQGKVIGREVRRFTCGC